MLSTHLVCLLAQSQTELSPLKIGDTVPQISTQHLLNYPSNKLKLDDLRGKLVILDFWSVHCSACIQEMPEMQAYQEKFKDRIQVLLVTSDSKAEIEKLHNNSKLFAGIKLPVVYEDHALSKLFPYTAYGLHVWIDKFGIVRYRTNSGSYTASDIADFLDGNRLSLAERTDTTKFNKYVPIFEEGNGRQIKHMQYYSCITSVLPDFAGSNSGLITDAVNRPIGVKFINVPVLSLYIMAYQEWGNKTFDSIEYNIKDSSRYFAPDSGDIYKWFLKNAVSYELHLPASKSGELFSVMKQDLERYFDLKGETDTLEQAYYTLSFDSALYNEHLKHLLAEGDSPGKVMPFQQFLSKLIKLEDAGVIADSNAHFPEAIQAPVFTSEADALAFLEQLGFKLTKRFKTISRLKLTERL